MKFTADFASLQIDPIILAEYLFGESYALKHYEFAKKHRAKFYFLIIPALIVFNTKDMISNTILYCIFSTFLFTYTIVFSCVFLPCLHLKMLKYIFTKVDTVIYLFYSFLFSMSCFVLKYVEAQEGNYLDYHDKWRSIGNIFYLASLITMYPCLVFAISIDAVPMTLMKANERRFLFLFHAIFCFYCGFRLTWFSDAVDITFDFFGNRLSTLTMKGIRSNSIWTLGILSACIVVKSIISPDSLAVLKSKVAFKI